jgi:hypothetical protein
MSTHQWNWSSTHVGIPAQPCRICSGVYTTIRHALAILEVRLIQDCFISGFGAKKRSAFWSQKGVGKSEGALCAFTLSTPLLCSENGACFGAALFLAPKYSVHDYLSLDRFSSICKHKRESGCAHALQNRTDTVSPRVPKCPELEMLRYGQHCDHLCNVLGNCSLVTCIGQNRNYSHH